MREPLRIFHALPYPMKCAAAGIYGYRLLRARYGPETRRLVSEAHERERWSRHQMAAWQEQALRQLLDRAASRVPWYRQRAGTGCGGAGGARLESWPVLPKEALRRAPKAFVADDVPAKYLHESHTSGSTGTPLTLSVSTAGLRRWYALFEARWRRWHGVTGSDPWAILGGRMVTRPSRTAPPYWVWNGAMRQLYLSVYHIAPARAGDYASAMVRHGVSYLLGYPSAISELARCARERGVELPRLRVVLSNAEPLFPHQRSLIQEAFGCPVRDTYGMAEMVAGAGECQHGTMHLWPEAGVVEVLDEHDNPAPPGEVGRFVCTGLLNDAMPLVRYEVGDRGAVASNEDACPCGRTLPILKRIEGRLDDVVVTPDGRRIGRLDTAFKSDLPVREAQIVQTARDELCIRVVPGLGFDPDTEAVIRRALTDRVGPMKIEFSILDQIPRGANGKFRAVLNRVCADDTQRA